MAKEEDDASSVSSCPSLNAENYSQLLQAFKETHEEANRLAILSNRLKGLNKWLENKVKALEEELENLKTNLKIYKCFTRTLLASVTYLFVKIVNLLKRRFTTL